MFKSNVLFCVTCRREGFIQKQKVERFHTF